MAPTGDSRQRLAYKAAGSRFQPGWGRRRPLTVAVGSVAAMLGISATAFASTDTSSISQASTSGGLKRCTPPDRAVPMPPRRQVLIFRDPVSRGVRAVAFCPDSRFVAAADGNGHAYVWSLATRKVVAVLADPCSKGVNAVAYRPRTKILATGDANGHVYLWQPGVRRPRGLADPKSKGVRAVAFSPNGRPWRWPTATVMPTSGPLARTGSSQPCATAPAGASTR